MERHRSHLHAIEGRHLVKRIVWDERERFGDWARERIGHVTDWGNGYQCIGLEEDGEPLAAVVFNWATTYDIAMHVAAVPGKQWLTRGFLRACFGYAFIQLGKNRVTGYVPSKNQAAIDFDQHLGFRYEGILREALKDDSVIILGMLRRECRWVD